MSGSNLRPAPFFLNEKSVREVLDMQMGMRFVGLPIECASDRPVPAQGPYPFRDHGPLKLVETDSGTQHTKIDLSTAPSAMEELAKSWREKAAQ